jgi:hypothetical protein
MIMQFALAPLTGLLALIVGVTPDPAATRRPVSLTASSACVQYQWTVTITVSSTTRRLVDLYDSSDYGNRIITDLRGVKQAAVTLRTNVKYTIAYHPGASAQYAEIGVFPAGSGGWDGSADPLAETTVRDPIQTDPRATC